MRMHADIENLGKKGVKNGINSPDLVFKITVKLCANGYITVENCVNRSLIPIARQDQVKLKPPFRSLREWPRELFSVFSVFNPVLRDSL
jgi:hypothetical protein